MAITNKSVIEQPEVKSQTTTEVTDLNPEELFKDHDELSGRDKADQHPISAITDLNTRLTTLDTANQANKTLIINESNRARTAEQNLTEKINHINSELSTVDERIAGADKAVTAAYQKADQVISTNLTKEINRAKSEETSIRGELANALTNANRYTDKVVHKFETELMTETSERKAECLNDRIYAKEQANLVKTELTNLLTSEARQRTEADDELTRQLQVHETTFYDFKAQTEHEEQLSRNRDAALNKRIDDLDYTPRQFTIDADNKVDISGAAVDGKYVLEIKQEDGLVTEKIVEFDQSTEGALNQNSISASSTDNTAPTSKAVYEYVKNLTDGLDYAPRQAVVNPTTGDIDITGAKTDGKYVLEVKQQNGLIEEKIVEFITDILPKLPDDTPNPNQNDNTNAPTAKAVADLVNSLDVESRVKGAETTPDGKYLLSVSEKDGIITEHPVAFDTKIENASGDVTKNTDKNAPTTKAVWDLVDSLDVDETKDVDTDGTGVFIRKIKEVDGKITATPEAFTLWNATAKTFASTDNKTAPTTSAVESYVTKKINDINDTATPDAHVQGKYVDYINQADGKITVSRKNFESTINKTESDAEKLATAPTVNAVINYVNTLDYDPTTSRTTTSTPDAYYTLEVSETDGVVSRTTAKFDQADLTDPANPKSTISSSSVNTNAPTTQNVYTFVKESIDALDYDTTTLADRKTTAVVTADGYYTHEIVQADGKVTRTTAKFDENKPSETSTDNTAPTSKAVWDLIDSLDFNTDGKATRADGTVDGKYVVEIAEENGVVSRTFGNFDKSVSSSGTDNTAPTTKAVYDYLNDPKSGLVQSLKYEDKDVNNIDAKKGYVSKVDETNGIIAVTHTAFETAINASTEKTTPTYNAPGTNAVYNYVKGVVEGLDYDPTKDRTTLSTADGKYTLEVTESDGIVSRTIAQFDTAIPSASSKDTNAPTSKAVYDFLFTKDTGVVPSLKYEDKDADNIDLKKGYVSKVNETNGVIAVTHTGFETVIDSDKVKTATIANNAPSSKAVVDFVNSSISSNAATFRGTFDDVSKLPTTGNTNNDYAYVENIDATTKLVVSYDRYKFVATDTKVDPTVGTWTKEYTLNNSSFTAAQWKAINSGAEAIAKQYDVTNDGTKYIASISQGTDLHITATTANIATKVTSSETKMISGKAVYEFVDDHVTGTTDEISVTKSKIGLDGAIQSLATFLTNAKASNSTGIIRLKEWSGNDPVFEFVSDADLYKKLFEYATDTGVLTIKDNN